MSLKKNQNIYVVILAGGIGSRIKSELPKQFLKLNEQPVLIHTLKKFDIPEITGKIIVMPDEYIPMANSILEEYKMKDILAIVPGGKTRQGSSYNALNSLEFNEDDILICHDAARPFVKQEYIKACITETIKTGASGLYVKAIDTIAEAENEYIKNIPSRDELYYTQTPQVFRYNILKEAHELALSKKITNATDDVSLVLDAGYKVKIVEGDYDNIKITTPFDLKIGEMMLKE